MEPRTRERITVLVVDDHRAVAEAIRGAMSSERGLAVNATWSGEQALEIVQRDPPHVILMDVAMPGMGGLEAARRILEADPEVKVIMLSAHDDDLLKARALETGASGYLSKISPMDQLIDAVRKARRGEPLHDHEEVDRLQRRLQHRRSEDEGEGERFRAGQGGFENTLRTNEHPTAGPVGSGVLSGVLSYHLAKSRWSSSVGRARAW